MEDDAFFSAQIANSGHILNHADFIVHEHHAEQYGVRANGCFQHVHVQQTVCLHIKVRRVKPLAFQFTESVEHGLVLGFNRDDVLAFCFVELRCTFDRQVVRLGSATCPNNFAGICANQVSNLSARIFHGGFSFPAPGVAAGRRIAKMLAQPRNHGVHNTWIARVRGAVVHVNGEVWCFHLASS